MGPSRWLPVALVLVLLPALGKPPVLDEESYLSIAAQIADHPLRPYDWWRNWQPWGSERPENAFLFAHPPLHLWWMAVCQKFAQGHSQLRLVAVLPSLLLLGWAVGRLAQGLTLRSSRAALLWLASPIVVMAVHAGWMMDVTVTALGCAGVACWWEYCEDRSERLATAAGLFLGLAACTKYPALLLVLAVGMHARRQGLFRAAWRVWAGFALLWGGLQAWLAWEYGMPHIWAVLESVPDIARGEPIPRAYGVWVRLGLVACPLVAVGGGLVRAGGVGALVAGILLPLSMGPEALSAGSVALLLLLGAGAGVVLAPALAGLRRSADSGAYLLGVWALLMVFGVVVGHNYSGGRYLLPATIPLVLGLFRWLEGRGGGLGWTRVAVSAWGLLSGLMALSEYRQAEVVSVLGEQVARRHSMGRFAGEWTFRWRMEREGWLIWSPGDPLEPGEKLAVPVNSGPYEVDADRLRLVEQVTTPQKFPIRVLDQSARVGYHGETLGILPVGVSSEPLERIRVYEVTW